MVVLAKPALEEISLAQFQKPYSTFSGVPIIDLSHPEAAKALIVEACEELGFFKVTNHGVPVELMERLEAQASKFFSKPQREKEKLGPANPFGYGSKRIGPNGDVGWVEYLLMQIASKPVSDTTLSFLTEPAADIFCSDLNEYVSAIRRLSREILELMSEGLKIQGRDVFSKLVEDEESDLLFRLNHYPPCPQLQGQRCNLTGFGAHTDPQLISVLRSNNSTGLQISLTDGTWVPVPPDHSSFFINVGDVLQVLTNGRFRSVRHRVLANGWRSRFSMIYFAGPAPKQRVAPLEVLMEEGEESLYRAFTWAEYKSAAYKSRLADNRLAHFEREIGWCRQ